jgi:hypothetical protein
MKTLQEVLKSISTNDGGQLSPENSSAFIQTTIDQSPFLKKIDTRKMTAATAYIDTIGVNTRQIRTKVVGQPATNTQGVNIGRRQLNTVQGVLPYDVDFSFIEENIEGDNINGVLNTLFATQFGNDLLDMGCNGDQDLPDTTEDNKFLRINNGWLKLFKANDSGVHLVDLKDVATMVDKFAKVLAAMPAKWKKDLTKLVFLTNPNDIEKYKKEIGGTASDLGIKILTEAPNIQYGGINLEPVPYIPEGQVALTWYKNLVVGIGRDMRVGKFVNERATQVEYTITAKFDFEFAVGDAIVYGYEFPAA